MRNNSLILLSKKGEILDKYKKIGKGPGEYIDRSELLVLGQYDRRWHVLDSNQQKVLLFKIEENQIIFDEEFKFDKPVSLGAISKNGKMYMNSFMGESLILKYSSDFELEDEFLPKEKKDMGNMSSEQMKDML